MTDDPNPEPFDMKARIEREEGEIARQRRKRPRSLVSRMFWIVVYAIALILGAIVAILYFLSVVLGQLHGVPYW
jgi:cytoskeletal protein RodZ